MRRYAGPLMLVAAILLGTSYFVQVREESERANCQARFNAAFAANLTLRSQLSSQRQDAEDNLLNTVSSLVLHPALTVADKQREARDYVAAFESYAKATAAYNAAKDAHPLPELPNC